MASTTGGIGANLIAASKTRNRIARPVRTRPVQMRPREGVVCLVGVSGVNMASPFPSSLLPGKVRGTVHGTDLGLALPAGPVLLVQFHEAQRGLDRLCLRLDFVNREAADDLLGFGERAVDHGELSVRETNAR